MSFDIKLDTLCNHLHREELHIAEPDGQKIILKESLFSKNNVKVKINGIERKKDAKIEKILNKNITDIVKKLIIKDKIFSLDTNKLISNITDPLNFFTNIIIFSPNKKYFATNSFGEYSEILSVDGPNELTLVSNIFVILEETFQIFSISNTFIFPEIPILDGKQEFQATLFPSDIIIKAKIKEDISSQITGTNKVFYLGQKQLGEEINKLPLIGDSLFFVGEISHEDIEIDLNGEHSDIYKLDGNTGLLEFKKVPKLLDTLFITYWYKVKVTNINGNSGSIVIHPDHLSYGTNLNQVEYFMSYYGNVEIGWDLSKNENSVQKQFDIIFQDNINTDKMISTKENINDRIDGSINAFFTDNNNLLPFDATLTTKSSRTLPSSLYISINETQVSPLYMDPISGYIELNEIPLPENENFITYYYRDEDIIPDIIEIDYIVSKNNCRKCNNFSYLDDFSYNVVSKDLQKVSHIHKLVQDVYKIILTKHGSNILHNWYGTNLVSYIGSKGLSQITQMNISREINNALTNMIDLQSQQLSYQNKLMSLEEQLLQFTNLSVKQDTIDPAFWFILMDIISKSGDSDSLNSFLTKRGHFRLDRRN